MVQKRTDIGLHLITNGRKRGLSWEEFERRVIEAPEPQKRGTWKRPDLIGAKPYRKPTPERQCDFVSVRTKKRCGCWAIKGATRCHKHGGFRQNPEHPGAKKRLNDITEQKHQARARQAIFNKDPKTIEQIKAVIAKHNGTQTPVNIAEGVDAIEQDDNGKAFRRWVKTLKANSPQETDRARKTKLRARK